MSRNKKFSELLVEYENLLSEFEKKDSQVPDYLYKPLTQLSTADKELIRREFYAGCNFPLIHLTRWVRDPRVLDGCDDRPLEAVRARRRLMEIISIRTTAKPDGRNWNRRFYQAARECVFVYRNLIRNGAIDYDIWATLRNFGYEWARPSDLHPPYTLPASVRKEAEAALRTHQKAGKG